MTPDGPGQTGSDNAGNLTTASSQVDLDQLSTQLTAAYGAGAQGAISQILAQIENLAGAASGGAAATLAAEGGIQYGTAGDPFLVNASKVTQPAGMLDVAVHGSPLSVDIGVNTVNHRVLAGLIERNPGFTGQPIRLLSCETGCSPNGFGQNLANKLGVPVYAPNDIIWAYPNGRLTIGPTAEANSGSFVLFLPGGERP